MERTDILAAMGTLKLYGMRNAYDGILATAVKRQHEPQQLVGDLLTAEINEKQARSIKYQLTVAKLPLAKDLDDFDFDAADINETLVRDLAPAASSNSSAMSCSSAAPGPARRTPPLPSPVRASVGVHGGASSMSSIWSTSLRQKLGRGVRVVSLIICPGSTSSSSTNWAICPSPRPGANSSSNSSANSTSRPPSSHHQPRLWRMAQRLRRS